jgi:hypothetical protein
MAWGLRIICNMVQPAVTTPTPPAAPCHRPSERAWTHPSRPTPLAFARVRPACDLGAVVALQITLCSNGGALYRPPSDTQVEAACLYGLSEQLLVEFDPEARIAGDSKAPSAEMVARQSHS